jgi:thymidylate synthase (FAD)
MNQNKINCLDHGFIILRNASGPTRRADAPFDADDIDPANTARISFDNLDVDRAREQDLKLYEYLISNKHNTPVEMIETWWEMKLPIFVARQFVRHRTACINEVSARYSVLPAEWYIPEVVGGKTKSNKQGQEDNLGEATQLWFKAELYYACDCSYKHYKEAIASGVAPEHARLFLHVNHYTHWVWKQDLSNLMHFLSLRLHPHAQVEARVYAQAMYDLLKQYLPKSMEFFETYRL